MYNTQPRSGGASISDPSKSAPAQLRLVTPACEVLSEFARAKSGSAHVVNLEPLCLSLGDRWDRKSDQIKTQVERYFSRHLGVQVFVEWLDETRLLIVHPEKHELSARISCVQATAALMRHFLGEAQLKTIQVAVVESFDGEAVACRAVSEDQLATILAIGDADLRRAKSWNSTPILTRQGRSVTLSISAEPVLSLFGKPKPVASYTRTTLIDSVTGETLSPAESGGLQPGDWADLDISVLNEVISSRGRERADSTWLIVPVAYRTLSHSSSRYRLFQEVQRLTAAERRSFAWEVAGLGSGIPRSRLTELVSLARPNCRGLICEFDVHGGHAHMLAGLPATLAVPPPSGGWTEHRLLQLEGRLKHLIAEIPSIMLKSVPAPLAPLASFVGATHCTIETR